MQKFAYRQPEKEATPTKSIQPAGLPSCHDFAGEFTAAGFNRRLLNETR
jgi:hypothetical protein